jgi:hypothetical protein
VGRTFLSGVCTNGPRLSEKYVQTTSIVGRTDPSAPDPTFATIIDLQWQEKNPASWDRCGTEPDKAGECEPCGSRTWMVYGDQARDISTRPCLRHPRRRQNR